jgi:plastocyanin
MKSQNSETVFVFIVVLVIMGSSVVSLSAFAQTANMPDQPTGVTAVAISPTSISLNWSPPQNNGGAPITGYNIEYRVAPSTVYITLTTLNDVTTYTHTNLITGKTYIYRISAINAIGIGNPSAEVLATPVFPATQTTNEIDIASGAGGSANTACVAANNCFTPNPLTVAPGTTVTWKNTDAAMHVICSGKPSDAQCGPVFEDDSLKPGQTYQFTFTNSGTFDYYCSIHPWMTGQVIVGTEVPSPTPTPQPTPVSISLNTDKQSYNQGDTIIAAGKVSASAPYSAVTLKVFGPHGDLIFIGQLLPASDGSFTKTFPITGPYWTDAGTYTIQYQYGSLGIPSKQTFYFSGGDGSNTITKAINATYALQSGNQIYNIPYIIKGGTVSGMNILAQQYTLEITLNTNADGSITVTLPRNMLDAKVPPPPNPNANLTGANVNVAGLEDSSFLVSVNGKQVTQFSETKNQNVRILSIPFHSGDSRIDTIGTKITDTASNPTPITVTTDKSVYTQGDIIKIAGSVSQIVNGNPVSMIIHDPTGHPYAVEQLPITNNLFSHSFVLNDGSQSGLYSVTIKYGNQTAETQFSVIGAGLQVIPIYDSAIKISGSNTYLVKYGDASVSTIYKSITIPIDTSRINNGSIIEEYQIPKKVIDTPGGQILLKADGNQISCVQRETDTIRILDCSIQAGTKQLMIVGTVVLSNTDSSSPPTSSISSLTPILTPTKQDLENINQAKNNQTIAAEVNIGTNANTTSIDNNVSVKTTQNTPDSLGVQVSATNQTGPKVIAFNLAATTINVANLKDLGIMYDGKLISPAPNMDAILHAKPTDNPSFAIVVTQSGIQVLVLVPHFSTHTITITNMTKVIPAVPEFPVTILVLIIATLAIVLIPKLRF